VIARLASTRRRVARVAAALAPLCAATGLLVASSAAAPAPDLAGTTAELVGRQRAVVRGAGTAYGPATMALAFDPGAAWRAFVPWAGIYRGRWTARGGRTNDLVLELDGPTVPAVTRLLDAMAQLATHVEGAKAQVTSYAIRVKRRRGRLDALVRARFLTEVNGELRRGVYRAELRGPLP